MTLRAQVENGMSHRREPYEQAKERGEELRTWAQEQRLVDWLSPKEREIYDEPLGSWTDGTIMNTFWRVESLKALLWAIGRFETMPSYLEGGVDDAYEMIPVGEDVTYFLAAAELRPEDELYEERKLAEFYHWRITTEILRLQGMQPPRGDSYEAVVIRALDGIDLPVPNDGVDILVDGTRFIDLEPDRKQEVMSIGYERHFALCWVTRDDPWDETHADT
jgi:hypothetical protein